MICMATQRMTLNQMKGTQMSKEDLKTRMSKPVDLEIYGMIRRSPISRGARLPPRGVLRIRRFVREMEAAREIFGKMRTIKPGDETWEHASREVEDYAKAIQDKRLKVGWTRRESILLHNLWNSDPYNGHGAWAQQFVPLVPALEGKIKTEHQRSDINAFASAVERTMRAFTFGAFGCPKSLIDALNRALETYYEARIIASNGWRVR